MGLWGFESIPAPYVPQRQPEWWERLPDMISAGGEVWNREMAQRRDREMAMAKMAQDKALREAELAAQKERWGAQREDAAAARAIAQGRLDVARGAESRQQSAAEDMRRKALESANVLPATEAEKMVPPATRDEPEVQPSMQSLAAVQTSPQARATGAVPQQVKIREQVPPWFRIEGPTRPIVGRLDIPPGLAERLGGTTHQRSVVAQRPVPERVGDIAAQIPGQMAAAQQRKQREYVGRHPISSGQKDTLAERNASAEMRQLDGLRNRIMSGDTNAMNVAISMYEQKVGQSVARNKETAIKWIEDRQALLRSRFPNALTPASPAGGDLATEFNR